MIDEKVIFEILDSSIQEKEYQLITDKPEIYNSSDSIVEYKKHKPPRKTISVAWNSKKDKGYFIIQLSYRRRLYEPGMFLVRFQNLTDEEELLKNINRIFKYWDI